MTFEIIGKIKAIKETNLFKARERFAHDSGWVTEKFRFNVLSGSNRFLMEINSGKWSDDKKNKIITTSREVDKATNKRKSIEIPWGKRFDDDIIDNVAGFKLYTCTLATLDEMKGMGKDKKREYDHNFVSAIDFADFVQDVLGKKEYEDFTFKVTGDIEFEYNKGRYYQKMFPKKIYKTDINDEYSSARFNFFFAENAVDKDSLTVSGYTPHYFKREEVTAYPQYIISYNKEDEKKVEYLFGDTKSEISCVSLCCDLVNGAEKKDITDDDIPDEYKEYITMGIMTREDVIEKLGGKVVGKYRTATVYKKSFGLTESTDYSLEDIDKPPISKKINNRIEKENNDDDDLHGDSDDDI